LRNFYKDEDFKELKGEHYKVIFIKDGKTIDIENMDTAAIFREFKRGNIDVYPKTILFAIASKAPSWLVIPILWFL